MLQRGEETKILPGAGGVQRPKISGPAFSPNQEPPMTYESMIDGPCCYHTTDPRKPANHTIRQCSWNHRIREEAVKAGGNRGAPPRQFPQKPNPNLSGANATPMNAAPPTRPAPARPVNVVNVRAFSQKLNSILNHLK